MERVTGHMWSRHPADLVCDTGRRSVLVILRMAFIHDTIHCPRTYTKRGRTTPGFRRTRLAFIQREGPRCVRQVAWRGNCILPRSSHTKRTDHLVNESKPAMSCLNIWYRPFQRVSNKHSDKITEWVATQTKALGLGQDDVDHGKCRAVLR